MSESRQTHVTLHDIDPQALDQLVQFAYTAEIVVGEGNVQVRASGRDPGGRRRPGASPAPLLARRRCSRPPAFCSSTACGTPAASSC